jgi:putative FmdB family regulatory protein
MAFVYSKCMPIYEYRCKKGHTLEVLQRMSDDALAKCTTCGSPVQRVFHPVAVHFKGSGFYNTDYGKRGSKNSEDGKKSDESKSTSDSSSDSSTSKDKSSSKSDSKSDGAKKPKAAADSKSAG